MTHGQFLKTWKGLKRATRKMKPLTAQGQPPPPSRQVVPLGLLSSSLNILFYFILCHVRSMQNFPGQGLNTHHSSYPSYCSDPTRSLTHCPTEELQFVYFKWEYCMVCELYLKRTVFKNQVALYRYRSTSPAKYHTFLRRTTGTEGWLNVQVWTLPTISCC